MIPFFNIGRRLFGASWRTCSISLVSNSVRMSNQSSTEGMISSKLTSAPEAWFLLAPASGEIMRSGSLTPGSYVLVRPPGNGIPLSDV